MNVPIKESWVRSPVGAIVLTWVGFAFALYVGATPGIALSEIWLDPDFLFIGQVIAVLGITFLSILLIYVLRNVFGGQGWDGLGLEWKWNKLGDFVGGFVLGVVAVVFANYIIVEVGIATWRPAAEIEAELAVSVLISSFITKVLGQALPEELWFRGHLYDTLAENYSLTGVIVLTSVVFGSFHILSQLPAGIDHQFLWVINATALGFVLVAGRIVTGAIWLPIGFHTGHNMVQTQFIDMQALDGGSFVVPLIWTGTLVALGMILLAIHSVRTPSSSVAFR